MCIRDRFEEERRAEEAEKEEAKRKLKEKAEQLLRDMPEETERLVGSLCRNLVVCRELCAQLLKVLKPVPPAKCVDFLARNLSMGLLTRDRMQGVPGAFENSPERKMRKQISRSAKVRSAAMQFWSVAGLKPEETMTKEVYMHIHRRISKALAPERKLGLATSNRCDPLGHAHRRQGAQRRGVNRFELPHKFV